MSLVYRVLLDEHNILETTKEQKSPVNCFHINLLFSRNCSLNSHTYELIIAQSEQCGFSVGNTWHISIGSHCSARSEWNTPNQHLAVNLYRLLLYYKFLTAWFAFTLIALISPFRSSSRVSWKWLSLIESPRFSNPVPSPPPTAPPPPTALFSALLSPIPRYIQFNHNRFRSTPTSDLARFLSPISLH